MSSVTVRSILFLYFTVPMFPLVSLIFTHKWKEPTGAASSIPMLTVADGVASCLDNPPQPRLSSSSCWACWQLISLSCVPLWSSCLQMESSLTPSWEWPTSMAHGYQYKMPPSGTTQDWLSFRAASGLLSLLLHLISLLSLLPPPLHVLILRTHYNDSSHRYLSESGFPQRFDLWPMRSTQCHVALGTSHIMAHLISITLATEETEIGY